VRKFLLSQTSSSKKVIFIFNQYRTLQSRIEEKFLELCQLENIPAQDRHRTGEACWNKFGVMKSACRKMFGFMTQSKNSKKSGFSDDDYKRLAENLWLQATDDKKEFDLWECYQIMLPLLVADDAAAVDTFAKGQKKAKEIAKVDDLKIGLEKQIQLQTVCQSCDFNGVILANFLRCLGSKRPMTLACEWQLPWKDKRKMRPRRCKH
jgi:hypothetical protein